MCSLQGHKDSYPLLALYRTKLAAESKLGFSSLNEGHSFRQCHNQENAPKTVVAALITLYFTGLTKFFHRKVPSTRKLLKVKRQCQSETNWQRKLQHAFRNRRQRFVANNRSQIDIDVELPKNSSFM